MFNVKFLCAILVMLWAMFMPVKAFSSAAVNVEADTVEYSELDGKTIFRGNVIATRAKDIITADEMIVSSTKKNEAGESITEFVDAKGNVKISTGGAKITGQWCRFNVVQDTLDVGGNAVVTQGTSVVRGQKLSIDLKTFKVKMQGGRVSGSFVPN